MRNADYGSILQDLQYQKPSWLLPLSEERQQTFESPSSHANIFAIESTKSGAYLSTRRLGTVAISTLDWDEAGEIANAESDRSHNMVQRIENNRVVKLRFDMMNLTDLVKARTKLEMLESQWLGLK